MTRCVRGTNVRRRAPFERRARIAFTPLGDGFQRHCFHSAWCFKRQQCRADCSHSRTHTEWSVSVGLRAGALSNPRGPNASIAEPPQRRERIVCCSWAEISHPSWEKVPALEPSFGFVVEQGRRHGQRLLRRAGIGMVRSAPARVPTSEGSPERMLSKP